MSTCAWNVDLQRPHSGEGPLKWTQIKRVYLGRPFGVHCRGHCPIWGPLEGWEANNIGPKSVTNAGPQLSSFDPKSVTNAGPQLTFYIFSLRILDLHIIVFSNQ